MREEQATSLIAEYFKLIPPTAGIMVGLIGALVAGSSTPTSAAKDLRYATIPLVLTIVLSLVGLQFMISSFQTDGEHGKGPEWPSQKKTVQVTFLLSWLSFVVGCVMVVYSLLQI
jgi:hypothetical protein